MFRKLLNILQSAFSPAQQSQEIIDCNPIETTSLDIAIDLIKRFEGYSAEPYKCPAGYLTFGYGCLVAKYPNVAFPVTEEVAEQCLAHEIIFITNGISKLIEVPLSPNQQGALISFCYNLGLGAFQSSTLRMKLNRADYSGTADEFLRWNKARVNGIHQELRGLTLRRAAERDIFLGNI